MRKRLALVLGSVLLVAMVAVAYAAFERAGRYFGVTIISSNNATPTCLYPNTYDYQTRDIGRYEVCWRAMHSSVNEMVFVSTFPTVNEVAAGWPFVGGEKECHDWEINIPLCFWSEDGTGPHEVRVLGAK